MRISRGFFLVGVMALVMPCGSEGFCEADKDEGAMVFEGTVRRAKSARLAFERKGRISYLHDPGIPVQSEVVDKENNIIEPGDVIARLDTTQAENNLEGAKAKMRSAEAALNEARHEHERCLKLKEKDAISAKNLESARKNLENAQAELQNVAAALANAKYDLDCCSLRAPFSGMIEEHYYPIGTWVDNGKDVVMLSLLSPICVRVPMPQAVTSRLGLTDSVRVFSPDGREVAAPWFDRTSVRTDYVDIYVRNKLVPVKDPAVGDEKLPRVHELGFVSRMHENERGGGGLPELWVNEDAVVSDGKGGFCVWRAKGQKLGSPEKPPARRFLAEAVKVEPLKTYRPLGIYRLRALKDHGSLNVYDLVLRNPPAKLKDGDTVLFQEMRWQFRPDEKVKVEVILGK